MTQVLLELNLVSIDAITAKNFVLDLRTGGSFAITSSSNIWCLCHIRPHLFKLISWVVCVFSLYMFHIKQHSCVWRLCLYSLNVCFYVVKMCVLCFFFVSVHWFTLCFSVCFLCLFIWTTMSEINRPKLIDELIATVQLRVPLYIHLRHKWLKQHRWHMSHESWHGN